MINNRIMKLNEFEDAIYYRAACDCSSSECDLTLELELDKEFDIIFLNLYKDLYWASYWDDGDKWYKNLWLRIKGALRILFTGSIKVQETFVFKGKDHIQPFIDALQTGMEKLDE